MTVLLWLVVSALAAAGAAGLSADSPALTPITFNAENATVAALEGMTDVGVGVKVEVEDGMCPRGCQVCTSNDLRWFFCGDQQLKYMDDSGGSYMEVVCKDAPLNCSALPPLPARRRGRLQRVEVTSCALPPDQPLTCATGGEGSKALSLGDSLSSLTAENVRGLDAEELFLKFTPGALKEIPTPALAALPSLRSLRLLQGSSLPLRGDMFLSSPPLTYLEVSMSGVRGIPAHAFRGLKTLQTLSLWGNEIEDVAEDAFNGLDSLSTLYLNNNPLRSLPARALARAPRLRSLSLERVHLASLQEGVFEGLSDLHQLKILSRANLTLGPRTFSKLPSLGSVSVTQSRVTSLPPDLFEGTTAVVNLTLNNNRIREFPSAALSPLTSLQRLDLSSNEVSDLPPGALLDLADLADLNLDHNRLRVLPPYVFAGLGKLTAVSLAHNQLVSISPFSFSGAPSLQHLSFSHNQLVLEEKELEDNSPFNMLLHLQSLDLSHNAVSSVFSDWRYILFSLQRVDLSYNNFTDLSQADLQFMSSVEVDFRHNLIATVQPRTPWEDPGASPSPARLLLGDNPYHCDCHLHDFLTQLPTVQKYHVDGAACSSPPALAGQSLRSVRPYDVTCPLRDVTAGCDCLIRPEIGAVECTCNNTRVPDITSSGMKHMSLRLTRLSPADDLRRLPRYVTAVNLTDLRLTDVPALPSTVDTLDVTKNKIEQLPDWLWSRRMATSIANNPLACECANTEHVLLLQRHKNMIDDYRNVTCSDGALVRQKDGSALCDLYKSSVLSAVIALSLILLAVLSALFYRYWLEIQVFLYSRGCCLWLLPKENEDLDKKYDVFVSFAYEDEKFVREEILPKLEGNYDLHVQDRDWVVGNTIPAEIHRSIEESRRTLILLSPNFRKSMWAAEEFRSVHAQATNDKRPRAVVVLLDVSKKEIDKETKTMLSLSTLLKYNEAMFWDKLRFALPRKDMYSYTRVKESISCDKDVDIWKGRGLDVVLNKEGKLINKGFVKDVV